MKPALAAASAAILCMSVAGGALAQDTPPQVERQDIMEATGDAMGVLGGMVKGERPYDGEEAVAALHVFVTDTPTFLTLFPEGSQSGHDTRAMPAIWQDRADFESKGQDLIDAAEAAKGPAGESLDALRASFRSIGQACKACHETYRRPES